MSGTLYGLAYADWVLLVLLLVFAARGGIRGFSGEVGNLLALSTSVFVLWVAWHPFARWLAHCAILPHDIRTSSLWRLLIFFALVVILFLIVYKLTAKLVSCAIGQPLDAVLGIFAASLKLLLIAGIVYSCCHTFLPLWTEVVIPRHSLTANLLTPLSNHLTRHLTIPKT